MRFAAFCFTMIICHVVFNGVVVLSEEYKSKLAKVVVDLIQTLGVATFAFLLLMFLEYWWV